MTTTARRAGDGSPSGGTDDPADPLAAGPAPTSPFPGTPLPLGATVSRAGTNFAVVADGADGVDLCLLDAVGSERRLRMDEQTLGIWHAFVPGVGPGQRYGYRVPANDPAKILLDPYARRVDCTDYDLDAAATPGVDTLGRVPLGIVAEAVRSKVPGPRVPWEHTVIYEAHVAGLTRRHPGVPAALRGTFAGIVHPAVIEHLHGLNVTTLELLPVHAHASEPLLLISGRRNYWGYSTLSYFAPHPGYATSPGREAAEFAAMVDGLHTAGIEVVLDVVYNHTCEGGPSRPVALSWRGLSPAAYYLPGSVDLTGTGNTVDPAGLTVVRMVTDSLRHWAGDLGVDGFRFDLAPVLGRPRGGPFDPASALLTAIESDPLLSTRKLIAEPWDATGEGYAVGRFRPGWAQWNDRFRGSVRDFWRGIGGVRDLGYRLSGSSDLFGAGRRPWASINFVTAHDGFTMRDLVSYSRKHNEANGEGNRDGTDDNRSSGYGAEGETVDPAILAVRARQARNLTATLLLSTGTPMLTMGDEMWHTQGGNNNPYCEDNETNWLHWDPVVPGPDGRPPDTPASRMLAFVRRTVSIRAEAPALHQGEFFEGRSPVTGDGIADLVWFSPSGEVMTDAGWFDDARRTLMMWLDGRDVRGHGPDGRPLVDDSWLLVVHSDTQPAEITLPGPPYGEAYTPVIDTATDTGEPADAAPVSSGVEMTIAGRSLWLLRAHRTSDPAG